MRLGLQYVLWGTGLCIQIALIHALLRGHYRRYPLVFFYSLVLLLTTVVEVSAYTAAQSGARLLARSWRLYYWINDAILQALIFAVVISLIYRALSRSKARAAVRRWLIPVALAVFAACFALRAGSLQHLSAWMTLVSRDLNFVAMILDLLLWTTLMAARKKDRELLMLSGGLGIQFAGAAAGQSVRQLALDALGRNTALELAGSLIVVLSSLACFFVWWRTFRRPVPVRTVERAGHCNPAGPVGSGPAL